MHMARTHCVALTDLWWLATSAWLAGSHFMYTHGLNQSQSQSSIVQNVVHMAPSNLGAIPVQNSSKLF
jgi:hypothetical protein